MKLILYNFTKKVNSTAIPGDDIENTEIDVVLKSGAVSKHSPVLELKHPISRLWDYAFFDSTYYWIEDFDFNDYDYFTLKLRIDVLATYRSIIMNTANYCLRTSVSSNGRIIDNFQPAEFSRIELSNSATFLKAVTPDNGWNIINVLGKQGVKNFLVSQDGMETICNQLFSQKQSDLWDAIKGAFTGELNQVINLTGYINDVYVLPFQPSTRGSSAISLGYFDTGVSGEVVSSICADGVVQVPIPHPVDTDIAPSYTYNYRSSKYVSYMLYIPCCGTYSVDADAIADEDNLAIVYWVDSYGNISGHVTTGGDPLFYITGYCAYRYAIGQSQSSTFLQTASSAIGSAITLNPGGVESALAKAVPIGGTVIGGNGNASAWRENEGKIQLTMFYNRPAPGLSASVNGYPYYAMITPSKKGYYIFRDAHVVAGEAWENKEIESFLNNGIFIE